MERSKLAGSNDTMSMVVVMIWCSVKITEVDDTEVMYNHVFIGRNIRNSSDAM